MKKRIIYCVFKYFSNEVSVNAFKLKCKNRKTMDRKIK